MEREFAHHTDRNPFFRIPPYLLCTGIILANIFPLWGVLTQSWSLFDVFYLYWIENVMIGVVTLIRILMISAALGFGTLLESLFRAAFFTFHYGLFCMAHGAIMFELFSEVKLDVMDHPATLLIYAFSSNQPSLIWAIAGLCVAIILEALGKIYTDRKNVLLPDTIMFSPYGRIIVLHVTIILGGLLAQSLGSPLWALLVLMAFKTLYDFQALKKNRPAQIESPDSTQPLTTDPL